jgi:hypothetical protein
MTGEIQESFELLKKCHVHNDMNIEFLKQLSRTLFLLGKPKSSIEVANEALKFDNTDWVTAENMRFNCLRNFIIRKDYAIKV